MTEFCAHHISVSIVCVCGFLHFTAASSTQLKRSTNFSLSVSLSDIVNIIKAFFFYQFAGFILSLHLLTGQSKGVLVAVEAVLPKPH